MCCALGMKGRKTGYLPHGRPRCTAGGPVPWVLRSPPGYRSVLHRGCCEPQTQQRFPVCKDGCCCCCCCQVASVVSDSVRPHRRQPTRLPRPWDSPGKNTGVGFHFLLQCMKVNNEGEVAQLCPTLGDSMDCSLPGSSVHGIFQARVLEWGAIAFSTKVC